MADTRSFLNWRNSKFITLQMTLIGLSLKQDTKQEDKCKVVEDWLKTNNHALDNETINLLANKFNTYVNLIGQEESMRTE